MSKTVKWVAAACLASVTNLLPAVAQAQTHKVATTLDSRAAVADLRKLVVANYVLSEVRPKLDAALAKGLAEGRYDVTDPHVLAERVNQDMFAVAHDKHLSFKFNPGLFAKLSAAPSDPTAEDAPPSKEAIRGATLRNHGVAQLRVLMGNVRYMKYDGFDWVGASSAEALDNAMRFLRNGDAAIIDLRANGGGNAEAVRYIISHFLPADRQIMTFYWGNDKPERVSTLADLPVGRMIGKPLYVLTSGTTMSAAEEFTGHVAGFKIGEVVGASTAGGGFNNNFFAVRDGMVASISMGRAVLASTGKDWEGVGIAPTVKVEPAKALEAAHALAVKRLAATAPANEKPMLEKVAAVLEARVNPVAQPLPLNAYGGTYGERTVTVEAGQLSYQRLDGPKYSLVGLGPNQFFIEQDPDTRVLFKVAGTTVTGFDIVRGDGSKATVDRTP